MREPGSFAWRFGLGGQMTETKACRPPDLFGTGFWAPFKQSSAFQAFRRNSKARNCGQRSIQQAEMDGQLPPAPPGNRIPRNRCPRQPALEHGLNCFHLARHVVGGDVAESIGESRQRSGLRCHRNQQTLGVEMQRSNCVR